MCAQVTNKCARIDIRDHRNVEALEIFVGSLLRAPVRTDWRELANNQSFNVGSNSFVVFRIGAVIADLRVGEYYDLSGVRRIGEDFLVSSERGIKNDFPVALCFRSVAFASEDAAIFQRKDCLYLFLRGVDFIDSSTEKLPGS